MLDEEERAHHAAGFAVVQSWAVSSRVVDGTKGNGLAGSYSAATVAQHKCTQYKKIKTHVHMQ